jgi:hypothetical protein
MDLIGRSNSLWMSYISFLAIVCLHFYLGSTEISFGAADGRVHVEYALQTSLDLELVSQGANAWVQCSVFLSASFFWSRWWAWE